MEKKNRSLAEEFEWYYKKKSNSYSLRHRLARGGNNPKYTGMLDRFCNKGATIRELEIMVKSMKDNMKPSYSTPEECLQAHSEVKIVNDWLRFKTEYEDKYRELQSSYDSRLGTISNGLKDNIPEITTVDFSYNEDYLIYRDSEGGILYKDYGRDVKDNPTDYTYFQRQVNIYKGEWKYYLSSNHYISGNAYKSGTFETRY